MSRLIGVRSVQGQGLVRGASLKLDHQLTASNSEYADAYAM